MKQQELICGVKIKGAMARKATPGQRAWAGVQPCTVLKFNEGGLQEAIIPAGEKRSVREIITEAMQPA